MNRLNWTLILVSNSEIQVMFFIKGEFKLNKKGAL